MSATLDCCKLAGAGSWHIFLGSIKPCISLSGVELWAGITCTKRNYWPPSLGSGGGAVGQASAVTSATLQLENLLTGVNAGIVFGQATEGSRAYFRPQKHRAALFLLSSSLIARYIMKENHGQRQHGQSDIWRGCAGGREDVSHILSPRGHTRG